MRHGASAPAHSEVVTGNETGAVRLGAWALDSGGYRGRRFACAAGDNGTCCPHTALLRLGGRTEAGWSGPITSDLLPACPARRDSLRPPVPHFPADRLARLASSSAPPA